MHFVVERHYASSDTDLWHWMNITVVEFSFFFCIKAEPTSLYSCNKIRKAQNEFFKIQWVCKGQMRLECIYEIIDFPKYHRKYLIDFCPASLFRLGMLCTHLSRVALRIIKTNHMYLPGQQSIKKLQNGLWFL